MPYPPSRPPSFRDGVEQAELELRGVRARAFRFRGGTDDRLVLPLSLPWETPPGADPLLFAAEVVEEYLASEPQAFNAIAADFLGGLAAPAPARRGQVRPP